MSLLIQADPVPLHMDQSGTIRVGGTRITLDTVVHAFNGSASAEEIAERFSSLSLPDVYAVIGYYLRHRPDEDAYLREQEREADALQGQIEQSQADRRGLRKRLLARLSGSAS